MKLFKGGVATEYKGGRTEDTIVNYIRKATGPPAKALSTQAEVDSFVADNKVAIVGFFNEASGALHDAFIEAAKLDDDHTFGIVVDEGISSGMFSIVSRNGTLVPAIFFLFSFLTLDIIDEARDSIVLFKKFDEGKNVYDGEASMPDVAKFVSDNSVPLVIPFSMEVVKPIFQVCFTPRPLFDPLLCGTLASHSERLTLISLRSLPPVLSHSSSLTMRLRSGTANLPRNTRDKLLLLRQTLVRVASMAMLVLPRLISPPL